MSGTKLDPPPHPQELFALLMENVRDYAIFTADAEGCISSWNLGAERILGCAEAEILGQSPDVIFTAEDKTKGEPQGATSPSS